MIPIQIQKIKNKWWSIGRHTFTAQLPTHWGEIEPTIRLECLRLLLSDESVLVQLAILKKLIKLPSWVWLSLHEDDLCALLNVVSWMKIEPIRAPIITAFLWQGKSYMLPTANFENGTAVQFPLADKYLQDFTEKGEEEALLKLVASLCMAAKNDKLIVEKRAELLRGMPHETQIAVMLYFIGIKQFIADTYGEYLFDDEGEEEDLAVRVSVSHFPNFGWWAAYLQIAESGVFGNYEQVLNTNFHRVIMYLIEKRKESKRMKAVYESQKQI
jgi:hypothetical protein